MKETGEQVSYFQNVNVSFVENSVETTMYSITLPIQINVRVVTGRGVTQSTYRPIHWPLPPGPDQVVPKQQYLNTINNP